MLLEARASAPWGVRRSEARTRRLDVGEAQPLRWGARLVHLASLMHLVRLARLVRFSDLTVAKLRSDCHRRPTKLSGAPLSLFILPQKNYCTILFYFLGFLPSFFLFLYFFLLLFFLFLFYLLFSVIICMMIKWFVHLIFFYIFCKTFVICYFNELRLISSIKRILYIFFYVNNVRLASINHTPCLAPRAWGSTGFCASMRLSPLITLIFSDSKLVVNQVMRKYEGQGAKMAKYLAVAKNFLIEFKAVKIEQVGRDMNLYADTLTGLALIF